MKPMSPIRVALADDHLMVRMGLRSFLEVSDEIVIVGECDSGRAAVDLVDESDVDVLLMDLVMPGELDGVGAIREIAAKAPHVKMIALTSFVEPELMLSALEAGALGYLHKDVLPDDLLSAISQVASGRSILEPQALLALQRREPVQPTVDRRNSAAAEPSTLTSREMDVLQALASGCSNKEIAARLGITEKTVKVHVSHIFAKMDVYDRTQAVIAAARLGYVQI